MRLAEFLRESDFTLGTFYPRHCITAVFDALPQAERVGRALQNARFEADEITVAPGRDVIEFERNHTTVLGIMMHGVSRFFKTEQSFNDLNLEHARHGVGFLIVRCSNENEKDNAWQIIKNENPVDARYYSFGGIEHLAGDPDTD
jgi:hypothetical protein